MKTALMILQLIPALLGVLASVEKMFPMSGMGKTKLALVRSFLETAVGSITDIWPAIEKIIEVFVSVSNKVGTFQTSSDTIPVDQPK